MTERPATGDDVHVLQAQVAALNELLDVQDKVVAEQSVKLRDAMEDLQRHTEGLTHAEKKFRTLFESSRDAIMMANHAGFLDCNKATLDLYGCSSKDDFVSKHPGDFSPPVQPDGRDSMEAAQEHIEAAFKDGSAFFEWVHQRMDGTPFPAEVLTSTIEFQGETALLATVRDITERKRAEEKMRRYSEELERANEEVRQFAYIVSHDLRAPLVSLSGFSRELRSAMEVLASALPAAAPHLDQEQAEAVLEALQKDMPEDLDFIDSAVSRMDGFVTALLKLSRLGRREMSFEWLDLRAIVESALASLAHQMEEKHVEMTIGPLPEMLADRTAVEQIVGNILTNAVNYLEPARPGRIAIEGTRGPAVTTFSIRDNGRGIAAEDLPKVFAPFRRAGQQNVKGEGMGMAFAQALARRHGGQIRCESQPGVGTTFIIVLSNSPDQGGTTWVENG